MKKQQGFTLIELIVVIVILGILAATALPRFANLQGDARLASVQGAAGALRSAAAIAHSTFIVRNTTLTTGTETIEGVTATNINGYPADSEMAALAGLGATGVNYNLTAAGTTLTVSPIGATAANCNVIYTEAADSATPATVVLNATQTGCQ
ncbi:MAG: type II secretion system GspH family protein [Gammaproteobacteria bacterium]|nr:type II secretion system GspH family protein [Gammaproteobacteria bacterium]MBU1777434.1 type II secretion system GspH family protein [Gammaproteobacteria bacterium]MBU1968371.1 type II secretion system GspH family protein [Gammaproteobacteria bacterium]